MKTISALLLMSGLAVAETWTGTVVDVMCKGKDPAAHSRQCTLSCAKGGYGIVVSDGRFLKFDERGNVQALGQIKALTQEKDLKATVTGEASGDLIRVSKIEFR